jgi:hypothetical protein
MKIAANMQYNVNDYRHKPVQQEVDFAPYFSPEVISPQLRKICFRVILEVSANRNLAVLCVPERNGSGSATLNLLGELAKTTQY